LLKSSSTKLTQVEMQLLVNKKGAFNTKAPFSYVNILLLTPATATFPSKSY